MTEVFDFFPTFGTGNYRTDSQQQDVTEFMFNFAGLAVILNDGKVAEKAVVFHGNIPCLKRDSLAAGTWRLSIICDSLILLPYSCACPVAQANRHLIQRTLS